MAGTLVQSTYGPPQTINTIVTGACAQTSTASTVVVTGTDLDATQFRSVSYTIIVATHDVDWSVFGANVSDYSDEVAVLTATKVDLSTSSSYSVSQAPFRYYRVKIIDDVGGTHGSVTVNGVAKS